MWGVGADLWNEMEAGLRVAYLHQNLVKANGGEVKVSWNPSDFSAEHMSMEVAPRWNPQEG